MMLVVGKRQARRFLEALLALAVPGPPDDADEHDDEDLTELAIDENTYLFSARQEIDYLNEKYHLKIPESEDYETLAGFILYYHESIPKINSVIKIGNFQFKKGFINLYRFYIPSPEKA